MREFLSKSIAAGLSTGVVLLWWPVLFDRVDTVTSWFARGVAWTVLFELLLVALLPFELAMWETAGGARVAGRLGTARAKLHSGTPRRRLSRLSALASTAVLFPVVLLVTGVHQTPARADTNAVPRPVKVVRVTKVVKVVQHAPVQRPAP